MSTCHIRRRREDAGVPSAASRSPVELSADEAASASCTEAACTRPLRALRRTGTLLGSLMSACSSVRAGIEAVNICARTIHHEPLPYMTGHMRSACMPGSWRAYASTAARPACSRPTMPQQSSELTRS